MDFRGYKTNETWVLLLIGVVATILLIVAVVKMYGGTKENDIQSFKVIFLDKGQEISSDDVEYCRFLEMYFDSFSFNEVPFIEEYSIQNLEQKHLVKVEAYCLNDKKYIVFLDLNEENSDIKYGIFNAQPTGWVVQKIENRDIFIIPGQHSIKLVEIFREMNEI